MREIEIKLKLSKSDLRLLKGWLEKNAEFIAQLKHKEFYLDNPKSTFLYKAKAGYIDSKEYLRVRMTEKGDSICLKRFEIDFETGNSKNIDEIEYKVSNGNEALKLFKSIGFSDIYDVSKVRKIYDYKNFEIIIDNVKSLGHFAEIEIKKYPENKPIEGAWELINNLIKEIGFDEYFECNRGYVFMLWNPNHDFTKKKVLK